jgi:hypothetical protein
MEQDLVAGGYDAVYGAVPKSPTLRRLWRELAEGLDYSEEFGHISFTTLPEACKERPAAPAGGTMHW